MTAPVVAFSADVKKGLTGRESFVTIDAVLALDGQVDQIEITVVDWPQVIVSSSRTLMVSHDEARSIIAGLASVIE